MFLIYDQPYLQLRRCEMRNVEILLLKQVTLFAEFLYFILCSGTVKLFNNVKCMLYVIAPSYHYHK